MNSFIVPLILCTIFVAANASPIDDLRKIASKRENICNLVGSKGLVCPSGKLRNTNNIGMYAGLGYNYFQQEVRYPVLQSSTAQPVDEKRYNTWISKDPSQLMQQIYGNHDKVGSGMYLQRPGSDNIFSNFYADNMQATVLQMEFGHFKASANISGGFDLVFLEAIKVLPTSYDEETYRYFVDMWGDTVTLETSFGGVIEEQSSVRSCVDPSSQDAQKDIDSIINTGKPSKDISYARYRKLAQINIVGGNPEITDITQRINTFKDAPVMTSAQVIPMYKLLSQYPELFNADIIKNLGMQYSKMISRVQEYITSTTQQIKNKIYAEFMNPQTVYVWRGYHTSEGVDHMFKQISIFYPSPGTQTNMGYTSFDSPSDETAELYRHADGSIQIHYSDHWRYDLWSTRPMTDGCAFLNIPFGPVAYIAVRACFRCQPVVQYRDMEYFSCVCPMVQ